MDEAKIHGRRRVCHFSAALAEGASTASRRRSRASSALGFAQAPRSTRTAGLFYVAALAVPTGHDLSGNHWKIFYFFLFAPLMIARAGHG
jgi:hypothetical protein